MDRKPTRYHHVCRGRTTQKSNWKLNFTSRAARTDVGLVVSGLHPAVEALRQRVASAAYRDVYLDLQATPSPEGRFLVMDANADGLFAAGVLLMAPVAPLLLRWPDRR